VTTPIDLTLDRFNADLPDGYTFHINAEDLVIAESWADRPTPARI